MTLKYEVEETVSKCLGIRPAARELGVNPGLIVHVLKGNESPTLRKILGVRKHPQRTRLTIDTDAATVKRFDRLRQDLTRRDFLILLLDNIDGFAEMEI